MTSALDGDPGPCRPQDPERAFQPLLKWSWTPPAQAGGFQRLGSQVTPLVANLTDDDGNGRVDLCDVPDVLVVTYRISDSPELYGGIVLLAGDTGRLQLEFDPGPGHHIAASVTPALGDLDGDGLPEVVTIDPDAGRLLIFDHRGRLTRVGADPVSGPLGFGACSAIALYDLEADGLPEIIYGATDVFDNQGRRRFRNDLNPWFNGCLSWFRDRPA